jgi:type IV pilus assembly protein PilB
MGPALARRLKVLAGLNIVEHRRPQDGQITTQVEGRALDIRISTIATIYGEKVVLRLLDKSRPLFNIADLGLSAQTQLLYSQMVRSPFGMLVCAGPTGSGKTTTLYATLSEINTPDRNLMTIEDPVEYTFPSINQIQINEAAGVTFAGGLRAMMRQDPDVILVGEIRDEETARTAVQAALTGHLVLSSLHATDAPSALLRLLDMGIEGFLVASSLLGVVSQRLLRRICTSCAAPYQPAADEMAFYRAMGGAPKEHFVKGKGCNFCASTGYLERVGVYELMAVTDEIKDLVIGGSSDAAIRAKAREQGMRTLREEGLRLVGEDVTTISEVTRCIYVG